MFKLEYLFVPEVTQSTLTALCHSGPLPLLIQILDLDLHLIPIRMGLSGYLIGLDLPYLRPNRHTVAHIPPQPPIALLAFSTLTIVPFEMSPSEFIQILETRGSLEVDIATTTSTAAIRDLEAVIFPLVGDTSIATFATNAEHFYSVCKLLVIL